MGVLRNFVNRAALRDVPEVTNVVTEDLPNVERRANRYFLASFGGIAVTTAAGFEYVVMNDHTVSQDLAAARGAFIVGLVNVGLSLAMAHKAVRVGDEAAREMLFRNELAAGIQQQFDFEQTQQLDAAGIGS